MFANRRIGALTAIVVGAAALACGGSRAVEIDPNASPIGTRWNATLSTPAGLVGALQVRGSGWMGRGENASSQTIAEATVTNATPGGEHPWHVHMGTCGNDQGILGEADSYPVLKVDGDGRASARAELSLPMPTSGSYFVNVHASRSNMGTIVACGNLAPPSR